MRAARRRQRLRKSSGEHRGYGQRRLQGERLEARIPLAQVAPVAPPPTFVVNSSDDVNDGSCNAAHCSLREAIHASNTAGADFLGRPNRINFDVPTFPSRGFLGSALPVIEPRSALPTITRPVVVDATTQPVSASHALPVHVILRGTHALGADGFKVTAGGSTIRGFAIHDFDHYGIFLRNGNGNRVEGNFVGVVPGLATQPNAGGIVAVHSANNRIGGSLPSQRNVVSGNRFWGILLSDSGSTGNLVQGNYVGVDPSGSSAVANGYAGVQVSFATGNQIGGDQPGQGNVIAGNELAGVLVTNRSSHTIVTGNRIGLPPEGVVAADDLGNGGPGIEVAVSAHVEIDNNAVAGNRGGGVVVRGLGGDDPTGVSEQTEHVVLRNNRITGNESAGVAVQDGASQIGVGESGRGNLISGNLGPGIYLGNPQQLGGGEPGREVGLFDNHIGTDAAGSEAWGNGGHGVFLVGAWSQVTASANLISGNQGDGIRLRGRSDEQPATGLLLKSNRIGTDLSGENAIPNQNRGIYLESVTGSTIGGAQSEDRNLVSGNVLSGIVLSDFASQNTIAGNFAGTNEDGTAALPNGEDGIKLENAFQNVVTGNLVSGNLGRGIYINDEFATNNVLLRNRIGTNAGGNAPLGNGGHGVLIKNANDNLVGDVAEDTGNTIAFNGQAGVFVDPGDNGATGNAILSNAIHDNGGLGIDLFPAGVNPNDADDADAGANRLQNYPVLEVVGTNGQTVSISGFLQSTANTPFRIEFFASSACDPSGYGEGERFLGYTEVMTDATGLASIEVDLEAAVAAGEVLTSTATNQVTNDTSEFSACRVAEGQTSFSFSAADGPSGSSADDGSRDKFFVRRRGDQLEVLINGKSDDHRVLNVHHALVDQVVIQGSGDRDVLQLDLKRGDALPVGGILFHGRSGKDSISVEGDTDYDLDNERLVAARWGILRFTGIETGSLTGGAGDNVIDASRFTLGRLTLAGLAGDDLIFGGSHGDRLKGGDGRDILHGLGGKDRLFGGDEDDQLFGGAGRDLIEGQAGNDWLEGGADADELRGGTGNDVLNGAGSDIVDRAIDQLLGDSGVDGAVGLLDAQDAVRDIEWDDRF